MIFSTLQPGDLIKVNFISPISFSPYPTVGIVLFSRKRNTEDYIDIKMLCNTGKIREFILGHHDDVVKIQ